MSIFTTEQDLIAQTVYASKRMFLGIYLLGFISVASIMFQALGKGVQSFIASVARPALILIPMLYLLSSVWQLDGIWYTFPLTDALTALVILLLLVPQIRDLRRKKKFRGAQFRSAAGHGNRAGAVIGSTLILAATVSGERTGTHEQNALRHYRCSGIAISAMVHQALACTSILVTKGASKDGSTMITYSMDSHELYGKLTYRPAGVHIAGTMRELFSGESGIFLGRVKEAPFTYSRVGHINEHQLAIAETTFTGREELADPPASSTTISLMLMALERWQNCAGSRGNHGQTG